jgi:hypothetical protein
MFKKNIQVSNEENLSQDQIEDLKILADIICNMIIKSLQNNQDEK